MSSRSFLGKLPAPETTPIRCQCSRVRFEGVRLQPCRQAQRNRPLDPEEPLPQRLKPRLLADLTARLKRRL